MHDSQMSLMTRMLERVRRTLGPGKHRVLDIGSYNVNGSFRGMVTCLRRENSFD